MYRQRIFPFFTCEDKKKAVTGAVQYVQIAFNCNLMRARKLKKEEMFNTMLLRAYKVKFYLPNVETSVN